MSVSVGPQQREEVRLLTSEASHQTPATATLSLSSLQVQHETRGVTYTAMHDYRSDFKLKRKERSVSLVYYKLFHS